MEALTLQSLIWVQSSNLGSKPGAWVCRL